TFCRWYGVELSGQNGRQLYIPRGFAHGFQTLTEDVRVNYLISEPYAAGAASGVRYDDPRFGIAWPLPVTTISEKDLRWPSFLPGSLEVTANHMPSNPESVNHERDSS